MNKLKVGGALLAVATAISLGAANVAAQQVTEVRIASDPEATSSQNVQPEGTEVIYVIFDYEGASNSQISVVISGPGALNLFSRSQRYSGSGTEAVAVSGADVYGQLGTEIAENAEAMIDNLINAQTQAATRGYMESASASIGPMDIAASLIARLPADDVGPSVAELEDAVTELRRLSEEAGKLPADADGQRQEIAAEMEPYAEQAADIGLAIEADAANVGDMPWPSTDSGSDEGAAYTVSLRVGTSPSNSENLWIYGSTPASNTGPSPEATKVAAATGTAGAGGNTGGPRGATAEQSTPGTSATRVRPLTSGSQATSAVQVPRMATATALALMASSQTNPDGSSESLLDPEGQPEAPIAPGAASDDQSSAGDPGGVQPRATWTSPASAGGSGGASELSDTTSELPASLGDGPNVTVIALGLAVLGAMAVFVRRRMI